MKLSKSLPSSSSSDYGKPFKEIFKKYNHDFYKIDGSLFSPALIIVNSKISGNMKFGYIFHFFRTELTSKNPKTLPIEFLVKKWSILM